MLSPYRYIAQPYTELVPNLVVELKCKIMHVGTLSAASEYTLYDASVGQRVLLAEADYKKDLGVWISDDLKPSIHCYKTAASAMKVLSMIRSFVNVSKELFT